MVSANADIDITTYIMANLCQQQTTGVLCK